jgi:hypothetical protein
MGEFRWELCNGTLVAESHGTDHPHVRRVRIADRLGGGELSMAWEQWEDLKEAIEEARADPGFELRLRYGTPVTADTAGALRRLGLRDTVHPLDAYAFRYQSQEAADAFAVSNREHHGHPDLGSYVAHGGVIGVIDLRHSLEHVTDPALPDDWRP